MYGMKMKVAHPRVSIELKPFKQEYLPFVVDGFSSLKVHQHTNQIFAQVLENEQEWYNRVRNSKDEVAWAIFLDGETNPIGVTGLHGIQAYDGGCTSGIIIWDQKRWGMGIASAAHLGRTLFAANYLNRSHIKSCVRSDNTASRKALERVGYLCWGTEPFRNFREGKFIATDHMLWINPSRTQNFFGDQPIPNDYFRGISKAKVALELAKTVVTFL